MTSTVAVLNVQSRILGAMITREFTALLGRNGVGLIGALLEPMVHLVVACLWHYTIKQHPIYGGSTIVYIATGLFAAFLFTKLSSKLKVSARKSKGARTFPFESTFNTMIATAVARFLMFNIAGVILFALIYYIFSSEIIPRHWTLVAIAIVYLAILGFGAGLINAVIELKFPMWALIWAGITRLFVIFAGIFYLPIMLPMPIRNVVVWNPVFQGIELFRQGMYPNYPTLLFSAGYAFGCCELIVVVGFCLEFIFRRALANPSSAH